MKNIRQTQSKRLISVTAIVMAYCTAAMAETKPLSIPPEIQAPAGNTLYLKASAEGTQNYVCLPSGWTFLGPQATLFVKFQWINGENKQQAATHFLSPNPDENGTLRAAWQSSLDTSAVWAKAIASSTDPNYVEAGAIPWLLLEATGSQRGPGGGSMLSHTTYIQRVNTSGGIKPTTGCSDSTIGSIAMAPYTTGYYFFSKAAK